MTKNKNQNGKLLFLPLGGCNEIGMNLNLYQYEDQWLMVDLGITFGNDLGVEILMPDISFIEAKRKQLVGLVLTHAHEDHVGAVPYLWERLRCPVYATPFTAYILKEKLKEVGLEKEVPIIEVPLDSGVQIGHFKVDYISITHSIPEPNVVAIKTPEGTIVHTGDWKVDPTPLLGNATNVSALEKLGDEGVLALVCDSTNVFVEGRTGSEADVREKLTALIQRLSTGKVVVACFSSNVARLETCAVAAAASGRRMVLVGRSMHRMDQAARRSGYLKGIPPFLDEESLAGLSPEKTLIVCTGSQGESRSALSRVAQGQHPRIKLQEGDSVVFSSRVIPGNEKPIKHLQEQLIEKGATVINASYEDGIHVSGHPARDDLRDMYQWVRPQILVPVHGEPAHLREHAAFALQSGIPSSIVPYNGSLIELSPEGPRIIDEIEHAKLALDGDVLVPYFSAQMRDRHRLMQAGVVFVSVLLDHALMLQKIPSVSIMGVVDESSLESVLKKLQKELAKAIEDADLDLLESDKDLQELIRLTVRRHINLTRGKKPLVASHIYRI
ncbi:MAG: ribonuclease J [Candidatus Nucleicultricaceae bacterium]